jgi:hypothetical protein
MTIPANRAEPFDYFGYWGFRAGSEQSRVGPYPTNYYYWLNFPYWAPIIATSILPALLAARILRQRIRSKRPRSGSCPTCGYDLRATPDRCPECGAVPENIVKA